MLQLAFRKFSLEVGGMWEITSIDKKQQHPFRLFQGIIKKHDARLKHNWELLEKMIYSEVSYCHNFFSDYDFSDDQISAIIDYKDCYALKEAVACLLYDHNYVVKGFLHSSLNRRGLI